MPTIVSASHAHELLAVVPQLTGFRPRDSAVLIALSGRRSRGAMRFDLPAGAESRECRRIATSMVGMISKLDGVDAVIPVVYTEGEFGSEAPYGGFVRAVIARADFSGFRVPEALCVAADGWGSYLDPDVPRGGRSLELIDAAAAQQGLPRMGEVHDGAALPAVRPERVRQVRSEYCAFLRLIDSDRVEELECRFPALLDLLEMMERQLSADPDELDVSEIALTVLMVQPPVVRDAVMLLWAFDLETGDRILDLGERFLAGEDIFDDPDAGLLLGDGPRPDPVRIDRAIALLRVLTAHAPREARPALLCMLAWLHWALGRASVAAVLVDSACDIEPSYGLAELLGAMLETGLLPEWAFDVSGE